MFINKKSYLVSKIDRWKVKLKFLGKIEGYKNHRVKYEGYKNLSPISHDCNISRIPNKFWTVRCVTPLVEKNKPPLGLQMGLMRDNWTTKNGKGTFYHEKVQCTSFPGNIRTYLKSRASLRVTIYTLELF